MTNGSSQGLFTIVSVVIFGIFVALSYLLFQNKMSTGLSQIFCDGFNQSSNLSKLGKGVCGTESGDGVKELPKFENSCDIDYTKDIAIPNNKSHIKGAINTEDGINKKYKVKLREKDLKTGESEAWGLMTKHTSSERIDYVPNLSFNEMISSNDESIARIYNNAFYDLLEEKNIINKENMDRMFVLFSTKNRTPQEEEELKELIIKDKPNQDINKYLRENNIWYASRTDITTMLNTIENINFTISDVDKKAYNNYNEIKEKTNEEIKYFESKGYDKKEYSDGSGVIYYFDIYNLDYIVDDNNNTAKNGTIVIPETIDDIRVTIDYNINLYSFEYVYLPKTVNSLKLHTISRGDDGFSNIKTLYAPNLTNIYIVSVDGDNGMEKADKFISKHCLTNVSAEYGVE